MTRLQPTTDGVITIRPPRPGDRQALIAGRDEQSRRFLGEGSPDPRPTGCIVLGDEVIGWVDHDTDRAWLEPGEVNVGYQVFPAHRGKGYASRAVKLLLHHLAVSTRVRTATLLIHPENERSLALADRTGFVRHGDLDGNPYWKQAVPPISSSDGEVTIRRREPDDLEADLEAKDEAQIRWLWLPGQRESWEAMSPSEQRAHALRGLEEHRATFGTGPKWSFTVDAAGGRGVAYVDFDLANEHVPAGEANISYASHPAHRGEGYVSAAVRLLVGFIGDHTGARTAHIITDVDNAASRRVARAVGAEPVERWCDALGHTMIRHRLPVRR